MKKTLITCFVALLALTAQAQVMKLNCTMGGDYNALYNPPDADSKSSSFPKKDRSDVWTYYMKYKPSGNGYHLNIPIRYCFINCFGEMYLWVTLVTKEVEYNGFYRYNGEDYLISEYYNGAPDPRPYLGKIRFKVAFGTAPSWGVSEVTGQEGGDKGAFDVFRKYTGGNLSLFQTQAEVTLSSVIDWDGFACLGQSYPMVDDKTHVSVSGMSNAELYAVIKYISVYKIEQLEVSCRDYTLEAAIKAKLDEKKLTQDYNKTMEDALAAYNAEDYQKALTLYQHASNLKPNEPLPKQRIQQCRDMIKKLKDEQDFKNYVSAGDAAAQAGNKSSARASYRAALAIKNDPDVKAKLDGLGIDEIEEGLAKIQSMVLTNLSGGSKVINLYGGYLLDFVKQQTCQFTFNGQNEISIKYSSVYDKSNDKTEYFLSDAPLSSIIGSDTKAIYSKVDWDGKHEDVISGYVVKLIFNSEIVKINTLPGRDISLLVAPQNYDAFLSELKKIITQSGGKF